MFRNKDFSATSALVAVGLLLATHPGFSAEPRQKPGLRTAPDFKLPDLNGTTIQFSRYRGKLVLLNFWATWCGPCLAEIPRFSAWQQKYASRGLQVIGVSMDDSIAPVQRAYRKYQLNYPVVMGDEHLGARYGGILSLPVTLLIDPQGRVLETLHGEPDLNRLETEIQAHLPSR